MIKKVDGFVMETIYLIVRFLLGIFGYLLMLFLPISSTLIFITYIIKFFSDFDFMWLKKASEGIVIIVCSILIGRVLIKIAETSTENWKEKKV